MRPNILDARILKAHKEGIEHWKRMRKEPNPEERPTGPYCALCGLLCSNCHLCPLETCSDRSPFHPAHKAFKRLMRDRNDPDLRADWKRKSTNMIRYMQRRLPKE